MKVQLIKKTASVLFIVVGINIASHFVFKRFDLTADKRYTLSETSLKIIDEVTQPLYVDVFLEGNFQENLKNYKRKPNNY